MKKLLSAMIIVALALASHKAYATSVIATTTGDWNSTTTWGGSAVPGCYDTIIIPAGITVTVTVSVNLMSAGCGPVAILVGGALNFQSGKKLDLPNGSYVYLLPGGQLQSGGGGGSSNIITINGTPYWSAGCTGTPPPDCGSMTGPDILCQNCSLPVELINFAAQLNGSLVELTWQTASEQNNDYFAVQRSSDGVNWVQISVVDGANNSSILLDYAEEDRDPLLGISYYRLKQVDNNGDSSFSETRVIANGNFQSGQELLIVPTEQADIQNIMIFFSDPIEGVAVIQMIGLSGQIVISESIQVDNEKWVIIKLPSNLAAGIYAVKANHLIEKVFLQ